MNLDQAVLRASQTVSDIELAGGNSARLTSVLRRINLESSFPTWTVFHMEDGCSRTVVIQAKSGKLAIAIAKDRGFKTTGLVTKKN